MKTVTLIPNTIAPNLDSLAAHLIITCGCVATARTLTLDCPDEGAAELIATGVARPADVVPDFSAERAWLKAYAGNFDFYLSLRAQLTKKGDLSEKQWAAITKAIARDAERAKVASAPKSFTLAAGTEVVVRETMAREIAQKAGCTRPHYGLLVLEVLAETAKAYQLRVRLAAVRASSCCVCGAKLTNPVSIEMGIGPVCGSHWGVGQDKESLARLAEKLRTFSEVVTWLPKSAIKERKEHAADDVRS